MIGTDGSVLDSQSFSRSDLEPGIVDAVKIEEGEFVASPFDYSLPVQILDVFLEFTMKQTHLWAKFDENGGVHGYFSGGVPLSDFNTLTELNDIGDVDELLESLLAAAADIDLDDDGVCDAISLVFEFQGVEAFFIPEE